MSLNIIFKKSIYLMFALATLGSIIVSCEPDTASEGNGLEDPNVDPSFTITPVAGKNNTYLLVSGTKNVLNSYWKVGKVEYYGKMELEVFLADRGKYTVVHTAVGRGGKTNTATKEIIIVKADPEKGNLVEGNNFADAAEQSQWTNLHLNTNGLATWTFTPGFATINVSGTSNQEAIYQAIDVVKDKEYLIDMHVSATSGSENFVFEVYAGKTVPTAGVPYTDNKVMGLASAEGCGKQAFDGKLSAVGCVKNSALDNTVSNVVKFTETGKIYLVIKSGGDAFTPTGIKVTEVELRGK